MPAAGFCGSAIAAGHSNKEIAAQLHVSPNTVKTHVARLLEKLGASRVLTLGNSVGACEPGCCPAFHYPGPTHLAGPQQQ